MSALAAFLADVRLNALPRRTVAALESIVRDVEAIIRGNGSTDYPTLWDHISDEAIAAAGAMPMHIWKDNI